MKVGQPYMRTPSVEHHTEKIYHGDSMKNQIVLAMTLLSCFSGAVFADNTRPTQGQNQDGTGGWQKKTLLPGEKEPHDGIEIIWQDSNVQQTESNPTANAQQPAPASLNVTGAIKTNHQPGE